MKALHICHCLWLPLTCIPCMLLYEHTLLWLFSHVLLQLPRIQHLCFVLFCFQSNINSKVIARKLFRSREKKYSKLYLSYILKMGINKHKQNKDIKGKEKLWKDRPKMRGGERTRCRDRLERERMRKEKKKVLRGQHVQTMM